MRARVQVRVCVCVLVCVISKRESEKTNSLRCCFFFFCVCVCLVVFTVFSTFFFLCGEYLTGIAAALACLVVVESFLVSLKSNSVKQ